MSAGTSPSQRKAHLQDVDGLSFLSHSFVGAFKTKSISEPTSAPDSGPQQQESQSTDSNATQHQQQQRFDIDIDPTRIVSANVQYIDTFPLDFGALWPRDPKGPVLSSPFSFAGKRAPNAHVTWSSNICGFYFVNMDPGTEWRHVVTQSMMAAECRRIGEAGFAKQQIERADKEEEPRRREWADVTRIWKIEDEIIREGEVGSTMRDKDVHTDCHGSNRTPFHPNSYPSPWPLVPFSIEPYKLQQTIPFHLLPEKLVVHDPFGLLSARQYSGGDEYSWSSKPDKTYSYHLKLSPDTVEAVERSRQEIAEEQSKKEPIVMFGVEFVSSESSSKAYFHPSSKNQSKSNFVTRITVPPSPPPESSIPIAHIYLSPARTVGEGNHSVVYSADWEIPRNIFVKWDICQECVRKEGEKAFWERKSGKSEVDTTAKLEDIHVDNVPWYRPGVDIEPCKHRLGESFSSLPPPNPPTALVSVIAKLSIQHDRHLANESENYQKFPSWMSEHWSGLTLAWPVRNLSRCGAIVPSWYGYYVPDETEIKKDEKGRVKYLSPIMLLEDCGVPIDYEDLTKRDKYACASLVTRFHYHGWLHNSLAPRNIVISYGDHTLYPHNRDAEVEEAKALMKISKKQGLVPYYALDNENEEDYMKDNQKRFRLIDFGRSTWAGDWVKEKMEYNQKRFDRWAGSDGEEKEEKEKGGQKKELGRTYMEEIFRDVSETYRTRWEEMRRKEKEEINKMMHWWFC